MTVDRIPACAALLLIFLILSSQSMAAERNSAHDCQNGRVLKQKGIASYYSKGFQGKTTANGEVFNTNRHTAASPDLPLGAKIKVTNEENGKSVDVKVNDRGPYVDGRVVDLSKRAAKDLGMVRDGVAPVTVTADPEQQASREVKKEVRRRAEAGKVRHRGRDRCVDGGR